MSEKECLICDKKNINFDLKYDSYYVYDNDIVCKKHFEECIYCNSHYDNCNGFFSNMHGKFINSVQKKDGYYFFCCYRCTQSNHDISDYYQYIDKLKKLKKDKIDKAKKEKEDKYNKRISDLLELLKDPRIYEELKDLQYEILEN